MHFWSGSYGESFAHGISSGVVTFHLPARGADEGQPGAGSNLSILHFEPVNKAESLFVFEVPIKFWQAN
jgi:hypothetical protein